MKRTRKNPDEKERGIKREKKSVRESTTNLRFERHEEERTGGKNEKKKE
jgi:hypothetical protein